MLINKNNTVELLENKFNDFTSDFTTLLSDYKRKSRRLDKIIKQSDKQQFQMIKLNEELDIYKEHLEKKVKEKTQELQELNKNLEQKVKEAVEENRIKDKHLHEQAKFAQLGELISNIAHQWRQPLSTISTTASGMQAMRQMDMSDKEDEDKSLKIIFDTTQNLSTTINNFSDFVNQKNEKSNINIQDLLTTNINIIASSLKNSNIDIHTKFPSNNIELFIISSSLSQVVLNILKNAQDALIKLKNDKKRIILVELTSDDKNVKISIRDNANGISQDILSKIFDPYFTTKHQSQGAGLGLYITRQNVEKYLNGKVEVITTNEGTQFIISLTFDGSLHS